MPDQRCALGALVGMDHVPNQQRAVPVPTRVDDVADCPGFGFRQHRRPEGVRKSVRAKPRRIRRGELGGQPALVCLQHMHGEPAGFCCGPQGLRLVSQAYRQQRRFGGHCGNRGDSQPQGAEFFAHRRDDAHGR